MAAALGLLFGDRSDVNLIKIALYPRALEAAYSLAKEKELIKPIPKGEYLICAITMMFTTYCYIFEPHNVGVNFAKNLDYYSGSMETEKHLFNMGRGQVKQIILESYPNNRLHSVYK